MPDTSPERVEEFRETIFASLNDPGHAEKRGAARAAAYELATIAKQAERERDNEQRASTRLAQWVHDAYYDELRTDRFNNLSPEGVLAAARAEADGEQ